MSNDMNVNLLDGTLDDLADLPAFEVIKAGDHTLRIVSVEKKDVGGKEAIEVKVALVETHELASAADTPNAPGTESNTLYMLNNEFGVGAFKEFLKPLAKAFGTSNIQELMAQAKNTEVRAVTTVRVDKNDPEKKYFTIKKMSVV